MTIEATVRIGKQGITETVLKDIKTQLRRKKIVKVKFLPSAIKGNKKELAQELAKKTGAKIVQQIGFVVVLQKNN